MAKAKSQAKEKTEKLTSGYKYNLDLVLEKWLPLHAKLAECKDKKKDSKYVAEYRELTNMLFDALSDYVFFILINRTYKAEAQDLTTKVLLKIYKALYKFNSKSKVQFKSWVYKITLNTYTDYIRKKSRFKFLNFSEIFSSKTKEVKYQDSSDEYLAGPDSSILEDLSTEEQLSRLYEYLEPKEKDILMAKYIYGFDYKELALMFEISEQAARKRVSRILQKLRKLVKEKQKS